MKTIIPALSILLCLPLAAFSAGVVNSPNEDALRAALAGGGTVTFNCDGTIYISQEGTLVITNDTTLDASGHSITLSGTSQPGALYTPPVRIFTVPGASTLSLYNLTIANGLALGTNGTTGTNPSNAGPGQGGAVLLNGGTLIASNCLFLSNVAQGGAGGNSTNIYSPPPPGNGGDASGGAIDITGGSLLALNCQFFGNCATGGLGGINTAVSQDKGNGGNSFGGAIHSVTSALTLIGCAFQTNHTFGGSPGSYRLETSYQNTFGGSCGGAIYAQGGSVTNLQCQFVQNSSSVPGNPDRKTSGQLVQGGAIYNTDGPLAVSGSGFTSNTVTTANLQLNSFQPGQGGAIFSQGSLQVNASTFNLNGAFGGTGGFGGGGPGIPSAANGEGGAIYCAGPSIISQSSFLRNSAVAGHGNGEGAYGNYLGGFGNGGAIYNSNTVSISGCAFSGNEAVGDKNAAVTATPGFGGALFNIGSCQLTNCTLVGNTTIGGNGGPGWPGANSYGAGIYNTNGAIISVNNTFASNAAIGGTGSSNTNGVGYGGAICNPNGTVVLYNTILAYSTSGSNCSGAISDSGYNLSSDASARFSASGSLNKTDPKLAPLDNYGGPTPTMALLSGSPAIDGANTATAPAVDQRGRARPYGAAADIGAFESSAPFCVKGTVSGASSVVIFNAGSTNVAVTNSGPYSFFTLPAGPCVVTPSNANYVFVPNAWPLNLGPDQINVNFNAYSWNSINALGKTNGTLHVLYAGTNGLTYRVLAASTLPGPWSPVATNTLSASNYFELYLPMTNAPVRFYQTVIP